MNRKTIENIIIFTVTLCETYQSNNGEVHPNYIDEKSRKYLGIDLSDYPSITVEDFRNKGFADDNDNLYTPKPPHKVLESIKDKIDLSLLRDYDNVIYDGDDWDGTKKYRVAGLDFQRQAIALEMIRQLDDAYFTKIIRDYNVDMLLDDNTDV